MWCKSEKIADNRILVMYENLTKGLIIIVQKEDIEAAPLEKSYGQRTASFSLEGICRIQALLNKIEITSNYNQVDIDDISMIQFVEAQDDPEYVLLQAANTVNIAVVSLPFKKEKQLQIFKEMLNEYIH